MAEPTTSAAVAFKKPCRKQNIRKRSASADADEGDAPAAADRSSIEMMRELQRQRQRAKGISLAPTGPPDAGGAAAADEEEVKDAGLESTFTAEADAGEVDPNMLKYIEEQMRREEAGGGAGGEGSGAAKGAGAVFDDPDGLYTTPTHMQAAIRARDEQENASRWLAGIVEVPVDADAKMAAVEETEAAKRALMAQRLAKGAGAPGMTIPTNFNSNFHQHRRERGESTAQKAARKQGQAKASGKV